MTSNDLISFEHITHISQKTTEQINQKNLKDFLITSLELQNISKEFYNNIYHIYFQNLNRYEIYAYNASSKNHTILEYQLFTNYYDMNNITPLRFDLFILEEYFCVYKNAKFYFAKRNNSYSSNEIIEYLEYTYQIKIEQTFFIDEKQIKQLRNKINLLEPLPTIKTDSSKFFLLAYIATFITLCILLIYSIIESNSEILKKQKEELNSLKKEYLKTKNKSSKTTYSIEVSELFNLLAKNKLLLLNFRFDKKYFLTLSTTKKEFVFAFINSYSKKVVVRSISKNPKEKNYTVELYIEN